MIMIVSHSIHVPGRIEESETTAMPSWRKAPADRFELFTWEILCRLS